MLITSDTYTVTRQILNVRQAYYFGSFRFYESYSIIYVRYLFIKFIFKLVTQIIIKYVENLRK